MLSLKTLSSAMACGVVLSLFVMAILSPVARATTASYSHNRMTEDVSETHAKKFPNLEEVPLIFNGKDILFRLFGYPPVTGLAFSIPKLPQNRMLVNLLDICSIHLFADWEYQAMSFRVRNFYECDVDYFWKDFSMSSEGALRDTKAGELRLLDTSSSDVKETLHLTQLQQSKGRHLVQESERTLIGNKKLERKVVKKEIHEKKLRACQYAVNAQLCVGGPILVNLMHERVKEEFLPKIKMLEGLLKLEEKDEESLKSGVSKKVKHTVKDMSSKRGRIEMEEKELMKDQEKTLVELKKSVKDVRGFLAAICKYFEREGQCSTRAREMGFNEWPIISGFFTSFVDGCRGIEDEPFG